MVKCKEMHITTTLKLIVKIAVYVASIFSFYFLSPWAQFLERLSQISSKVFSSKNMQLEVTKYF